MCLSHSPLFPHSLICSCLCSHSLFSHVSFSLLSLSLLPSLLPSFLSFTLSFSHPFFPSTSPPLCLLKVWILGEYSHTGYDARCTTSLLVQYFEVGETMFYSVQKLLMRKLILCALPPPSLFLSPFSLPSFPTLLPTSSQPPPNTALLSISPPLLFHYLSSTPLLYPSLSSFLFSSPFFLDIRVYSVRGGAKPSWPG